MNFPLNLIQLSLLCRVFGPEFVLVFFAEFLDHVQCFADQLFANDFDEFVLLESFARHVQWQIIRIDHTADKVQIIGHDVLEIVGNENTSDVKLNKKVK